MPGGTVTDSLAVALYRALPRTGLSRAVGRLADARPPAPLLRAVIGAYIRYYRVDMAEAIVPDGGYPSFNAFFTRALRPGARPIDPDPELVTSPADGRVIAAGAIDDQTTVVVKDGRYRLAELAGGDVELLRGGRFAVVYLSPRDYHRVHAPAAGRVVRVRRMPGTLFPVNPVAMRSVPALFTRNQRVAVWLDAGSGPVVVVLVGALNVGRVTLAFEPDMAPKLGKGDPLGAFELGSTAVVLLPPGFDLTVAAGTGIRVGEPLARRVVSTSIN